jgi:hypothetical protein
MSHPTTNGVTPPNTSTSIAQFNHQINPPVFPPTQQYQYNTTPTPTSPLPSSNTYNTIANSTSLPTNHYNPSPQPTFRPMYPSPASAYRPQVQQPQFIPQISQPSLPPSSTYPYPYSNTAAVPNTAHIATPTYPGQPPPPMPYAMGGATNGTPNQPMNHMNGPFPTVCLVNLNIIFLNFYL